MTSPLQPGKPVTPSSLLYVYAPPLVRLVQQAGQTGIASGVTQTLTFGSGSTDVDNYGFHDETVNNSRVTPTVAGWYRLIVKPILAFNANITGTHAAVLRNGSVIERQGNHRPNTTAINCAGMPLESWLTANGSNDYFEAAVNVTTSSGTWATNAVAGSQSVFMVEYMRPL